MIRISSSWIIFGNLVDEAHQKTKWKRKKKRKNRDSGTSIDSEYCSLQGGSSEQKSLEWIKYYIAYIVFMIQGDPLVSEIRRYIFFKFEPDEMVLRASISG